MTTNRNQCTATTRAGQPCPATPQANSAWCYMHDPDRADERDEARQRGGSNRSNVARLRGLVPPRLLTIFDALEQALTEVHDGALDPRQAQAMASLARALVAVLTAGELEQRVRDLESRAAA
jgi:hypothetical protein